MENSCNLCNNSGRGQNGNCTNVAWDIWDHHWSSTANDNTQNSFHHHHHAAADTAATESTSAGNPEESAFHALLFSQQGSGSNHHCSSPYARIGTHYHPDPHLMCLKLGKRNYFEDTTGPSVRHVAGFSISKRGKPCHGGGGGGGGGMMVPSATAAVTVAIRATVPRCQVEGCHVALLNAKDYHRRHKVCELHSKAPRVVVLGLEQRFCQQCSRFHVVTEFDDSKRSCRRRLAGHNERRRKSSHEHSVSRNNPSQGRFPYLSSPTGRALSLLSSRNESLISSPDLSSRCSAALRELIAENRATLLARQLIVDKDWPFHHHHEVLNWHQNDQTNHFASNQHQMFPEPHGWDRFNGTGTNNVTLDLMQTPTSAFELLSMRGKSKEEEECSQLWSCFGGSTHVI